MQNGLRRAINSSTIRLKDLHKSRKYYEEDHYDLNDDFKYWIIAALSVEIQELESEIYNLYEENKHD